MRLKQASELAMKRFSKRSHHDWAPRILNSATRMAARRLSKEGLAAATRSAKVCHSFLRRAERNVHHPVKRPPTGTFLYQFMTAGVFYFYSVATTDIRLTIHVMECVACTVRPACPAAISPARIARLPNTRFDLRTQTAFAPRRLSPGTTDGMTRRS